MEAKKYKLKETTRAATSAGAAKKRHEPARWRSKTYSEMTSAKIMLGGRFATASAIANPAPHKKAGAEAALSSIHSAAVIISTLTPCCHKAWELTTHVLDAKA